MISLRRGVLLAAVCLVADLLLSSPAAARAPSDAYPAVSAREVEAFRRGLETCWRATPDLGQDASVTIEVRLAPDGTIIEVIPAEDIRTYGRAYRAAAESARRAVRNCRVHLNAPPETYDEWSRQVFTLRPAAMDTGAAAGFECASDLLARSLALHGRMVRAEGRLQCFEDEDRGLSCRTYCAPREPMVAVKVDRLDPQTRQLLASECTYGRECRASIHGLFRKRPRSGQIDAETILLGPARSEPPPTPPRAREIATAQEPVRAFQAPQLLPSGRSAPLIDPRPAELDPGPEPMVVCAEGPWVLPRTASDCLARSGKILDR